MTANIRFKNFLKNSGYVLTSSTFVQILVIIQGILMARILGVKNYGIYTAVIASASFINKLVDFRAFEAVIRFMAKYTEANEQKKAVSALSLSGMVDLSGGLMFFLLMLFLSGFFAEKIVKAPGAKTYIILYSLYLFVLTTNSTIGGTLRYLNKYSVDAAYGVAKAIFLFAGIIILLFFTKHPLIAFFYLYVSMAFVFLPVKYGIFIYFLKKKDMFALDWFRFWKYLNKNEIKEILKFLLHTNISSSLYLSVKFADVLIIGYILNPYSVGIYKVAKSITSVLRRIVNPMYVAIYPELSNIFAQHNRKEFKTFIAKILRLTLVLLVPALLLYIVFTKQIIVLLVSAKYTSSVNIARIMTFGVAIDAMFFWLYPALLSMSMTGEYVKLTLISTVLFLLAGIPLTRQWGAVGMAGAYSLFYIIQIALSYYYFNRALKREL